MGIGNAVCALLSVFVLFGSTSFSSTGQTLDEFKPINCTQHSDCDNVCFRGEYLFNRCDVNGTCVCDCSNETIVTSSYAKPSCDGKQPDGFWRDYCDKYCNQEYLRPFRYCNIPTSECYCTCVCVYPRPKP